MFFFTVHKQIPLYSCAPSISGPLPNLITLNYSLKTWPAIHGNHILSRFSRYHRLHLSQEYNLRSCHLFGRRCCCSFAHLGGSLFWPHCGLRKQAVDQPAKYSIGKIGTQKSWVWMWKYLTTNHSPGLSCPWCCFSETWQLDGYEKQLNQKVTFQLSLRQNIFFCSHLNKTNDEWRLLCCVCCSPLASGSWDSPAALFCLHPPLLPTRCNVSVDCHVACLKKSLWN